MCAHRRPAPGPHVDDVVGRAHHVRRARPPSLLPDVPRRCSNVAIRRSLSRWCRPMLGSSSTYITPSGPRRSGWPGGCAGPRRRQRLGAAVQAQVVQAHVVQELQPRGLLAHHLVGNLGLAPTSCRRRTIIRGTSPSVRGSLHRWRGAARPRPRARGGPRGAGACPHLPGRAGCCAAVPDLRAPPPNRSRGSAMPRWPGSGCPRRCCLTTGLPVEHDVTM